MNPVHGSIVGREAELAVVRRFLGGHADGPASLTLLFIKGTTIVSILFGGTGAQDACVAVAKVAASKL